MSITGTNIGLKHSWGFGFNGWATENDKNLRSLDVLVQANAIAMQNTAPSTPADGDTYIVGAAATGIAWGPWPTAVARYNAATTAWEFWWPKMGWCISIGAVDYTFNGTAWTTDFKVGGKLVVNGSDRILSDGSGIFSSLYSSALAQNAIPRSSNASGLLAASGLTDDGTTITAARPFAFQNGLLRAKVGASTVSALYPSGVTPSGTNYALDWTNDGATAELNGSASSRLNVADVTVLYAQAASITAYQKLILAASTTSATSLSIPSGTAPTTRSLGDVYTDNSRVQVVGGVSIVFQSAQSLAVSVPTSGSVTMLPASGIGSKTIPANRLAANSIIRGKIGYIHLTPGSEDHIVSVVIGGVTVLSVKIGNPTGVYPSEFFFEAGVISAGASGSMIGLGCSIDSGAIGYPQSAGGVGAAVAHTVDTTVAQSIDISIRSNNSTAGSFTVYYASIEILG